MAIVFAMRGSTVATYSNGGATASVFGNTAPTTAADVTACTGNVMIWAANNNAKGTEWPGRYNTPNNRTIAVNINMRVGYVGTPASTHNFWSLISGSGKFANLEIGHNNAGNLVVQAKNESAALVANSSPWATYSASSASYTDFTFMWNGDTTPMRLYVNSTLFGTSVTPTAAFSATWNNQMFTGLCLGTGNMGGVINGGRVAEFTVWDSTFDMTVGVPLDNGTTVALTGTRSSPISVQTLDGAAWTTLSQLNVRNATIFTAAGVGFTGSLVVPSQANVINGISFDNTTGTYVTATTANVKSGITFGPLSALTGSYVPASVTVSSSGGSQGMGWPQIY